MAASHRTSGFGGNASGGFIITTTFTPAVGDLVYVFALDAGGTSNTNNVSDDNGGTYIQVAHSVLTTGALSAWVRTSQLANTTPTTVSYFPQGGNTGAVMAIEVVQGSNGSGLAANRQHAQIDNQAPGTATVTLGVAPITSNMLIGCIGCFTDPPGMTAPSTWTQQEDIGESTPIGIDTATVNSGFTSTAVTWGTSAPSTWSGIVIELDASGRDGVDMGTPVHYCSPRSNVGLIMTTTSTGYAPIQEQSVSVFPVLQNTAANISTVMYDATSGAPLPGLASIMTIKIEKNCGSDLAITPSITDRGDGRYTLSLTSSHTDTLGKAPLKITAPGAQPNNSNVLDVIAVNMQIAPGVTGGIASTDQLAAAETAINAHTDTAVSGISAPTAAQIRDAILNEMLSSHTTVGSVADGIAIASGMLQGNFYMDNTNNTDPNGQTASRIRIWRSAAAMSGVTPGGTGQGEFAIFLVTTSYVGPNQILTHQVIRTL